MAVHYTPEQDKRILEVPNGVPTTYWLNLNKELNLDKSVSALKSRRNMLRNNLKNKTKRESNQVKDLDIDINTVIDSDTLKLIQNLLIEERERCLKVMNAIKVLIENEEIKEKRNARS